MRVTCYAVSGETTSPRWAVAFARGCGGAVAVDGRLRPGPAALFGSPKLKLPLREIRRDGRPYWYGDHAFFRRFRYFRIARDCLHYDGAPDGVPDDLPAARRRCHSLGLRLEPWRAAGGHVLVCPPDARWADLIGFDAGLWRRRALTTLRRATDRELRIRTRQSRTPLAADLKGCWALVTHSSNAAVEAVLAGVPVFVTAPCGAAWVASGRTLADLRKIERPRLADDRETWLARLARHQWALDEMASGEAWAYLGDRSA